jgi:hypothetical protein
MSSRSTTKQYEWSEVSPSVAVVETVADLDDAEIEALPPLAHVLDVDALDELLRGTERAEPDGIVISFRYREYEVSMSSSGWLEVEG